MARLQRLLQSYEERLPQWIRIGLAVAWVAGIWWASSQSPERELPYDAFRSHVWNLGHLFLFGVLAALIHLSTVGCTVRAGVLSAVAAAMYGVIDEWHQAGVKGRSMDAWDAGTDALGACIFVCAVLWIRGGHRVAPKLILLLLPLAACTVHMAARPGPGL